MADFAVIGMGRFGRAVARQLHALGGGVLAIDKDAERLSRVSHEVDSITQADTTSEETVQLLGLERLAAVIVAIGPRGTEASLLTTALLRDAGVGTIVARSFDERHARLQLAVGATLVLNPEEDMGRRLAHRLAHPTLIDQLHLGEVSVGRIEAPESTAGESLDEVEERLHHGLAILAIRRADSTLARPEGDTVLESGDELVVLGPAEAIEDLAGRK